MAFMGTKEYSCESCHGEAGTRRLSSVPAKEPAVFILCLSYWNYVEREGIHVPLSAISASHLVWQRRQCLQSASEYESVCLPPFQNWLHRVIRDHNGRIM